QQHDDPIIAALLRAVMGTLGKVGDLASFDEQSSGNRNASLQAESDLVPGVAMTGREVAPGLLRHDQHVIVRAALHSLEQALVSNITTGAVSHQTLTPG